jgi:hypothetical protein
MILGHERATATSVGLALSGNQGRPSGHPLIFGSNQAITAVA